ncbi:TIGR01777 family oxidoreductase [Neptunitalea lumnitzerae]|uniref:NAD-dependent epimerase n=1 Tax=Neptunitalea lumnitzerae TaxID=2965509 RepID=A0ABQ5MMN3_9FLAO|nr:TIGR01777 family oxidoreductase [Neptunitalea sp. Y10]GLB50602.1 NAD-dependent epimerase [Neptunitalea sp. Y10]
MKILITGATGLIGSELVRKCLTDNIEVNYLTTSKEKIKKEKHFKGFFWNPNKEEIDLACLEGVSAIIHLAGASIAKRWTPSYKEKIVKSRTETTRLLYKALIESKNNSVKQIISASGISIYPSSFETYYHEDFAEVDDSFLGEVVEVWENAADKFKMQNIKVAKIRTGLVLSTSGGVLEPIVKTVKYGVGAPLASGKQWQSWIHIDDITGIYLHVLKNTLEGVYNAVAPQPVTNKEMTKEVATQLHRFVWPINVPKFMLKLVLGQMSYLVFSSQKVAANKVIESGYSFKFSSLKEALADVLK